MKQEIIEAIVSLFGYTNNKRARIRKYHAEMFYGKIVTGELIISPSEFAELSDPEKYIRKLVNFSNGMVEYINEGALELKITDLFVATVKDLDVRFSSKLDTDDKKLAIKGINLKDESVEFSKNLTYARFYKLVSTEEEQLNNPMSWTFSEEGMPKFTCVDFSDKDTPIFKSEVFMLKFQLIRKIDDVAFITSKLVMCPVCNSQYTEGAMIIDFGNTYKCKMMNPLTGKLCGTTIKKFQPRSAIPTYIYEVIVETRESSRGTEFKEFFMESFVPLETGFHTGIVFCRSENKTNNFYFTCLRAKDEESPHKFSIIDYKKDRHKFFDVVDSVADYIRRVGFVLDDERSRLPFYIETLKRIIKVCNKEINMDHSLYFGAPGIGKTYSLTLLHYAFYSNSGVISGPRFSVPGLTGGQKDVLYQDSVRKKNVPGMFSREAFIFDEINNQRFMDNGEAINLFKSVALESQGTSATVGGKEFIRTSLVAASGNYDMEHLRHYENTVKKIYSGVMGKQTTEGDVGLYSYKIQEFPEDFDFFNELQDYGAELNAQMRLAIIKARSNENHYLTKFPKPFMERFYWTVLVHPKYDKTFLNAKRINIDAYLGKRDSIYSNRELLNQLYITNLNVEIEKLINVKKAEFTGDTERCWSKDAEEFVFQLSRRYNDFFSMFTRLDKVHVFALYTLSMINGETKLSFGTKRLFERLISTLHKPIDLDSFHQLDFDNYTYVGERRKDFLDYIKDHPNEDVSKVFDFSRERVKKEFVKMENDGYITRSKEYCYTLNDNKEIRDEIEKYRREVKHEDINQQNLPEVNSVSAGKI